MNRNRITARIARSRELAKHDRANRCTFCKRALPPEHLVVLTTDGEALRYCGASCVLDHESALAALPKTAV